MGQARYGLNESSNLRNIVELHLQVLNTVVFVSGMRYWTPLTSLVCALNSFRQSVSPYRYSDALSHFVIPNQPTPKPHTRMLHHFRFILPLLPRDEDGLTDLHYYDSAIQVAQLSRAELLEEEFELGRAAAERIKK